MATMPDWRIRNIEQGDEGFVAKCWVETLRGLLPHLPHSQRTAKAEHDFRVHWYDEVKRKLESKETRIACDGEHEAVIIGWCWPNEFVYVRSVPEWRNQGVAQKLWDGPLTRLMVVAERAKLAKMLRTHTTGKPFAKDHHREEIAREQQAITNAGVHK